MDPSVIGIGSGILLLALFYFMWRREGPRIYRAREMIKKGARLIDVSEPAEFALDHIEGATNIPLEDLTSRSHEIGAFEHPVVVCGRGKMRAARAAHELRTIGFQEVLNLGHADWKGFPSARRESGHLPV